MMLSRMMTALSACAILLCALPAHAFDPCVDASSYTALEQRYTKGLLFKIEKCKSPVSYIFGTVHLARPDVAANASNAFLALHNVQAAGFELAESASEIAPNFNKYAIALPGNEHLLSHQLGSEYYGKLVGELQFLALFKGNYIKSEMLDKLKPWAVLAILEIITEQKDMALDEKLQIAATFADKPVFGLETIDEQAQIFSALPDAIQIRMLKELIDHYPEFMKLESATIEAYLAKDINKIESLSEQSFDKSEDRELDDMMRDRLLIKRNRIMEQRLLPRLGTQSVMVSVGVAHLPGKDGILHLLEQDGYFITPMP